MGVVALEGLEFFAHHGFYDEEQKIGNKYGLDIYVTTDLFRAGESDDLSYTVNYERIYEIAKQVMEHPARLLEHIGVRIIRDIRTEFTFVDHVKVRVYKFNPPIGGICRHASVTVER